MKVTYIHHSSFLAELENSYLLFDYYQGAIPTFTCSPATPTVIISRR